ncbi:amidohydrolase [Algoriphagus sp. SE2]|uniref:amidohydrolase n=1 Tax=Algoriphagus sp. SE2 TaxID=3141536 RepID=UPI0031CD7A56
MNKIFFLILILFCLSCDKQPDPNIIITGENIITMSDDSPTAIAIYDNKIIASGTLEEIIKLKGEDSRIIDLGEKALIPGFIDAHGHLSIVANRLGLLDLSPPPINNISSIEDIINSLNEWIENNEIKEGELVFGVGYDDSFLMEKRHPNRYDLDKASKKHPIIIRHVSGHLIAVNSLALETYGVTSNTEAPPGGVIQRISGGKEPNGIIEETAMGLFPRESEQTTDAEKPILMRKAFDLYASYGITTIQDCNVGLAYVEEKYTEVMDTPFPIDVVSYVYGNGLTDQQLDNITFSKQYTNGYRNAGIKFGLDGSPQGRTAWLSKPYTNGPPGAKDDYVAYPTYDSSLYKYRVKKMIDRGAQVLVHANGDQAIELMINGVAEAVKEPPISDHRSVIIHAQLIREDQLNRAKHLNIIPSYFSAHPFFWGDWHRLSFGDERASFISPVGATIEKGIPFTIHNDSPVIPPDMMRLISITVNRKTRNRDILGADQRATVMQALYASTLGGAYQYFEEDMKGSIEVGKYADLVILSENPLSVNPDSLDQIQIIETFSKGKSVYRKSDLASN